MRRIILTVLVGVVILVSAGVVVAQETKGGMMMDEGMMRMHMMHGMMGKASMVSSNDGGVIVMIGKTLYKYDKNLNIVKQVDLPMDMPQMNMMDKKGTSMMNKKGGCSCGSGMCGGQTSTQTSQQQSQSNKAASDHESHH